MALAEVLVGIAEANRAQVHTLKERLSPTFQNYSLTEQRWTESSSVYNQIWNQITDADTGVLSTLCSALRMHIICTSVPSIPPSCPPPPSSQATPHPVPPGREMMLVVKPKVRRCLLGPAHLCCAPDKRRPAYIGRCLGAQGAADKKTILLFEAALEARRLAVLDPSADSVIGDILVWRRLALVCCCLDFKFFLSVQNPVLGLWVVGLRGQGLLVWEGKDCAQQPQAAVPKFHVCGCNLRTIGIKPVGMWAGEHIQSRTQDGSSLPGAGPGSIYHLSLLVVFSNIWRSAFPGRLFHHILFFWNLIMVLLMCAQEKIQEAYKLYVTALGPEHKKVGI